MPKPHWSGSDKITVQLVDLIGIVSLFVVGLILTISYGFQYWLQGPQREFYFALFTVPFAVCLLALLIIPLVRTRLNSRIVHIPRGIGLLPIFAMFSASVFFYADNPTALSAIGLSSLVVVMACTRFGFDTAAYLIIVAGLTLFCILLVAYPIDVNGADMLPIIEAAVEEYLHGRDVYAADYSRVTAANLFIYLPLQWLVYVPFVAAEIDIRLLHVILAASTFLLFVAFLRQNLKQVLMIAFWPVLLSPVGASMFVAGQVWLFWFLIVAFLIAFINERLVLAAAILGTILATRQTSLAIGAAVAVFMVSQIPVKKYFFSTAVLAVVYLALTLPFTGHAEGLLSSLYFTSSAAEFNLMVNRNPMNQVALVNWVYVFGIESMRPIIQVGAGGCFLLLIFLTRNQGLGNFLILTGVMYLVVISLNSQVFRYYYVPGLIIASFGIALSVTSTKIWRSSAQATAVV